MKDQKGRHNGKGEWNWTGELLRERIMGSVQGEGRERGKNRCRLAQLVNRFTEGGGEARLRVERTLSSFNGILI